MKSRILLGGITIALVALGCQKVNLSPEYSPRLMEIRDDAKDSITGVWCTTKHGVNDGYPGHVAYLYEDNFMPIAVFSVDSTGDTTYHRKYKYENNLRVWDSGTNTNGDPLIFHYEYYPGGRIKTWTIGDPPGGYPHHYFWNDAGDSLWQDTLRSSKWIEVDSNQNILSWWRHPGFRYTYKLYIHPNPIARNQPINWGIIPWDRNYMMDTAYYPSGDVWMYQTIDSLDEWKVYNYTNSYFYEYDYDWTFLTNNAQ